MKVAWIVTGGQEGRSLAIYLTLHLSRWASATTASIAATFKITTALLPVRATKPRVETTQLIANLSERKETSEVALLCIAIDPWFDRACPC